MAIICTQIFSSNMFNVHKSIKTMTCELSTLRDRVYNQLYDDACDVGFGIISEKTGHVAYWAHDKSEFNDDGDLTSVIFKPITETINQRQSLKDWTVEVFND